MNNLKYKNGIKIKYNDKPSSVWSLLTTCKVSQFALSWLSAQTIQAQSYSHEIC
jgi:hypothetical protein